MKKFQILIPLVIIMSLSGHSMIADHFLIQTADSLHLAKTDSTEYDIIIFDSGFESWLLTHAQPIGYHTNEYYRNKNIVYVAEWNSRVRSNRYRAPYEFEINYNPSTDYGEAVNYKIYWYFKYMEQKFRFNLFGSEIWH